MRTNVVARTHEGAPAVALTDPVAQLRRSLMACLLFEKSFYESGKDIAQRIAEVAALVPADQIAELAIEARTSFHLRHAPLLLLEILSRRNPSLLPVTMEHTLQRVDEMAESLAIMFACQKARGQNKRKIPHSWSKGIHKVLPKFDEYQLAKYDRRGSITLRDVLRIARPKPNDDQAELWRKVVKRELTTPDTWEVALSGGADKKETFERLLREGKLGYLALLRNLRNMVDVKVNSMLVTRAILDRKNGAHRVLPFRFVAAARAAPIYASALNESMGASINQLPELPGRTIVLVDVSGSMDEKLSAKSDMTRMDAAAALACIVKGERKVFTFSNRLVEVTNSEPGLAGMNAILSSQGHEGTYMGAAIRQLDAAGKGAQRLIVITDEQSHDQVGAPQFPHAYMINVGSYKNGVGYGEGWTAHITGFSENVLRYIQATEGRLLTVADADDDA